MTASSIASWPNRALNQPTRRIYLSPPHMSGLEHPYVAEAIASNWVAPLGPNVDAFEQEFAAQVGTSHALALNSGTAALHLALRLAGVGAGDEVFVGTLTFVASVNPIVYLGAAPVLVDSELRSWNMDPALLEEALEDRARKGRLPRAVVVVHLYGQAVDMDPVRRLCEHYSVPIIEDAAEALGAKHRGRHLGSLGLAGVFSFNGNKVITTSGGGMLVSNDQALIESARKLAAQAREPAHHYEHREIGYNYRLSNLLAAVGRAQLTVLEERVEARRRNFAQYVDELGGLPGLQFMPEAEWGRHSRWLTCITIDPGSFGSDREAVRAALEQENIESRPVWKPMHRQPVFAGAPIFGGAVADLLFDTGLCLPSGSDLSHNDISRVADVIRQVQSSA